MPNTHYLIGGLSGAKLSEVSTTPLFALGTVGEGNNGSKWFYGYSSAVIGQYQVVGIEASGTATTYGTANDTTSRIGIAQIAFATAEYGWIALEGNQLRVATNAAVAVGVPLYTTETEGNVDDATSSASGLVQIQGLYLTATASGTTASSAACLAFNLTVRGGNTVP